MPRHHKQPRTRWTAAVNRLRRSVGWVAAVAVVVSAVPAAILRPAPAHAAGGPFTCQPTFFQVQSGQLKTLNPVTGAYSNVGSKNPDYNAIGFDVQDKYLYGIDVTTSPGHLLRIANDGSLTDLGLPTNLPANPYYAADMDASGHLIVAASATTWYSVDVTTTPAVATALTITGATGMGNDLVVIGSKAYTAAGTTLFTIDLSALTATAATITGAGFSSGSFGAAWTDQQQDLFIFNNPNGKIFQLTGYTTPNPVASLQVTGIPSNSNDGAACASAPGPFNPPVANADSYAATSNITLTVNAAGGVLANDVGTNLTVATNTTPTHGTLAIAGDGSFTYTPTVGYSGPDSFTYTAVDAFGRTSGSATVTFAVNLPAAPTAPDYNVSAVTGTTLTVPAAGVLTSATGTGITLTGSTAAAHGTATLNMSNGGYTYLATAGTSGNDAFTYTVTDGFGRTATGTVHIAVAPTAANDTYSTPYQATLTENAAAGVLANDVGTVLSTQLVTTTAHGALTLNGDGSFTYVPSAGYAGPDSFVYKAKDSSNLLSASATVSLTVTAPALPTAVNDGYSTPAGAPASTLTETAGSGVLANDTGTGITVFSHTAPTHGVLALAGDGSFTYTPSSGFSGHDSFTYTLHDALNRPATATVNITVIPVAAALTGSATSPAAVVVTPPAPVGTGPFSLALATTPPAGDGTAVMDPATGVITFTPNGFFHGTVPTFTYIATDSAGVPSLPATIDLTEMAPAAPVLTPLSTSTPVNTPVTATFAAPVGFGPFTWSLTTVPSASAGSATIASGMITFTPAAGFSGLVAPFLYTVTDAYGQSSSSTVTVSVVPAAAPASGKGVVGNPVTFTPGPPTGSGPWTWALVPSSLPAPTTGTMIMDPHTGLVTFTPAPNWTGTVTARYVVTDGSGLVSPGATLAIEVVAAPVVEDPPAPDTGSTPTAHLVPAVLLISQGVLVLLLLRLTGVPGDRRRRSQR